jgi:hypothetical protein
MLKNSCGLKIGGCVTCGKKITCPICKTRYRENIEKCPNCHGIKKK